MKYYTDGWMMGKNPSLYGGGFTVINETGKVIVDEEIRKDQFTNNEAEIRGIKFALEYANVGDSISTDSMCCLTWVNTGRSKSRPDFNEMLQTCKFLKEEKKINLMWEGRNFNTAGKYNENRHESRKMERIAKEYVCG